MGNCTFCGNKAGFLKKSHRECKLRYEQGREKIISAVGSIGSKGGDLKQLESTIEELASTSFINQSGLKKTLTSGWEKAVDIAYEDGILSEEEENTLITLKEHFSLSKQELDENGAFTKVVKGAVIRDILEGKLPERININGTLPFNLQKNEQVVWVFQDVEYYEEKSRTRYIGGSQGVSVRIAKGLYYRTGSFKGERVQTSETIHSDTGLLGITNKNIYFAGSSKSFRISYNKIVSFQPYSDGIGLQRDAQTAKPQSFITGDGWFTYNLIANLSQM